MELGNDSYKKIRQLRGNDSDKKESSAASPLHFIKMPGTTIFVW